jgi:mRNA interferase RelE/StbE
LSYRIEFRRTASKALDGISANDRERILEAIAALAENPRPFGCQKLSARAGWRIRSQNYRVIYDIDDGSRKITIEVICHRRDVYRR